MNGTTRTTMWQRIQTYVIVTMIAVLIWLYAESENVRQHKPLTFNIRFVPAPGQELAIDKPSLRGVRIIVRCATGQYMKLREMLGQTLELTVHENRSDPNRMIDIDLVDRLDDTPIGKLGVSFVDVQPPRVTLRVEQLVEVKLPISSDGLIETGVKLTSPPLLEPSEATIRVPASEAEPDRLGDTKLALEKLDPDIIEGLDENVPRVLTVPIVPPRNWEKPWWTTNAGINPGTTKVTLTIRKQTDQYEVSSVPILLVAPWSELERFSVSLGEQRLLPEPVSIAGPSDVIQKIRNGDVKVWAELRLSAEDLEKGITSKQVHLNIPSNARIESAIPLVTFTITPRQSDPQPNPTIP